MVYTKKESAKTVRKSAGENLNSGENGVNGLICTLSLADKRWVNVILEAGEINVEFEKDEKRISGTPINDLFYKDYIRPLYQVRVLTEPQNRKP